MYEFLRSDLQAQYLLREIDVIHCTGTCVLNSENSFKVLGEREHSTLTCKRVQSNIQDNLPRATSWLAISDMDLFVSVYNCGLLK